MSDRISKYMQERMPDIFTYDVRLNTDMPRIHIQICIYIYIYTQFHIVFQKLRQHSGSGWGSLEESILNLFVLAYSLNLSWKIMP